MNQPPWQPQGSPSPQNPPNYQPPWPPNQGVPGQPGWQQPPTKPNQTPLLILGTVAILAIAGLVIWLVLGQNRAIPIGETSVVTTPVETTPIETTPVVTTPIETTPVVTTPIETTPVVTTPIETTPVTQPTAPANMPTKVGDLTVYGSPGRILTFYRSADSRTSASALYRSTGYFDEAVARYPKATKIRDWTCGIAPKATQPDCVIALPFRGYLSVNGFDGDTAKIAAWGDQFLATWK